MLVQEGKLEYRVSVQEVERFTQLTSSPLNNNLPGQPGSTSSNIDLIKLKPNSSNLNFYGFVEDQPPEWAKLDYSLEVEISYNISSVLFPDIKEGVKNSKLNSIWWKTKYIPSKICLCISGIYKQ